VGSSSNSSQIVFLSTSRAIASTSAWSTRLCCHSMRRQSLSFLAMKLSCGVPEEQWRTMYEAWSYIIGCVLPTLPCGHGCRVMAIVFACLLGHTGQHRGRAAQPVKAPIEVAHAGTTRKGVFFSGPELSKIRPTRQK
jgi:hypothetical protein